MHTKHLRRTAALLRSGASCEEVAAEQLDEAADKIDRLQAEHRLIVRTERGEAWFWQGDGCDFPESLGCPVVIDEGVFRDLLKRTEAAKPATADSHRCERCNMPLSPEHTWCPKCAMRINPQPSGD